MLYSKQVIKERTGYINDITRKALDEYLKVRDKLNPKTKNYLLVDMA